MSDRLLLPGRVYRFLYPAINFECLRMFRPLVERQILVSRIRDTVTEPLDDETLSTHPYTCRGRFLATGIDLHKVEERSFYVDSMEAVVEVADHELAQVRFPNISHGTEFGRDAIPSSVDDSERTEGAEVDRQYCEATRSPR